MLPSPKVGDRVKVTYIYEYEGVVTYAGRGFAIAGGGYHLPENLDPAIKVNVEILERPIQVGDIVVAVPGGIRRLKVIFTDDKSTLVESVEDGLRFNLTTDSHLERIDD